MDSTQLVPGIGSTWAGGADGMDVTAVLLSQIDVSPFISLSLLASLTSFVFDAGPPLLHRRLLSRRHQTEQAVRDHRVNTESI